MQKQLAAHPELANDEVALQEVNAAFFKEYLPLLQKSEPTIKQPVRWKNALGELNANLDISIAAVSYTHLDVYKRQVCFPASPP